MFNRSPLGSRPVTFPHLLPWLSLGLSLTLFLALLLVRRRRLRAATQASSREAPVDSMRETLARKIRDGADFSL